MEESGERKPIEEGIEPEKELNTICRVCKEDKSPIQFGRGPVRELDGINRVCEEDRCVRRTGGR